MTAAHQQQAILLSSVSLSFDAPLLQSANTAPAAQYLLASYAKQHCQQLTPPAAILQLSAVRQSMPFITNTA